VNNEGFTPAYQQQLLRKGHHLLPWIEHPPTDRDIERMFKPGDPRRQKYVDERMKHFETIIKQLARDRLPISFLATQWESILTYDQAYFGLPADQNPNVIGLDGKIQAQLCPFGPIKPWREAGKIWTDNLFLKKIQEWYPDPPLILFISNNEHAKQQWSTVEQSKRYLDKYRPGKSSEFKRRVVGDGWIERYGAMLDAMRDGLANKTWRKNARFVGYEAFPPVHLGRWGGWKEYSLTIPNRLDPQPGVWDGGSPSYYLHNWMAITDYTLWSPQIETMNWVFMLDEIHKTRPHFWFELSTWDGDQPGAGNDKRKFYARLGEPFTLARYEGMVQFGTWLMRPRSLREFRSHVESVEYAGPSFQAILDSVDRVWSNPTLQRFWRHGRLVANPRGKHPYQADVPAEYQNASRWFLLETSLTPKELAPQEFDNANPPTRQLEIPVFALAYVLGKAPEREWLIYAHSPRLARTNITITVPEYGAIKMDVPQSGSFFHVTEREQKVRAVVKGGPASFRVEAPQFAPVGTPVTFAVSDKYSAEGDLEMIRWEMERDRYTGEKVVHSFTKPGQHLVTVSGWRKARSKTNDDRTDQNAEPMVRKQIPIFVGMKPEKAVVCRLLMKGALQDGFKSWIWHGGWDKVNYTIIPDASGSNNIGFLAGGKWVQDDQRGLVLELDGKHDRVEVNNSAKINAGKSYPQRSIAFWFRPAAIDPGDGKKKPPRQVLYEEGGSGSGLNLYLDGDVLVAGAWKQSTAAWLRRESVMPAHWHHLALVLRQLDKSGTQMQMALYLDGARVADGKPVLLGAHPGDVNLGRSGNTLFPDGKADNPGYSFAGRLDDFRIVNRAFSDAEVRNLAK
jgi:hypothetical protein